MSAAGRSVRGYRPDVEGLRAIAVGLVILYHAGIPGFPGGFVGVDVFFVLSGFLITGLLADELTESGHVSLLRFYGRRARRLLPLATLVLASTAIVFSFLLSPIDHAALASDIKAAALYAANWHFAALSLNYLADPGNSPVLHFWSLGVEEQFYVVWPLLLLAVAGRAARSGNVQRATRLMTISLALLAVASFAISIVATYGSSPYAYYGLHTRAWELAAGGLLALSRDQVARLSPALQQVCGLAGLVGIVLANELITATTPFPGYAAALPIGATVLVVLAGTGAESPGVVTRALGVAPMTYVGRISYALYLWHWPCLVAAGVIVAGHVTGAPLGHGVAAMAAIAAAVALSVVSHYVLEDPVRRSRWLAAARGRSLRLGAALTAVSLTVGGVLLPASSGAVTGPVTAVVGSLSSGAGAVRAQTFTTEVTLQQTPAAARGDRPRGTRACYGDYRDTDAPADCLFGDVNGTRAIALVGDSQAQQWFPALDAAARQHHWQLWLWSKPACPLIDLPIKLPQFQQTYPWCTQWRSAVIDRLETIDRLDAVVVADYANLPAAWQRYAGADGTSLTPSTLPTAWGRGWSRTLAALSTVTPQVVVMRDSPRAALDVPSCIAAHGRDVRACSFSWSRTSTQAQRLEDAQRNAAVPQALRQSFVRIRPLLCPADTCPVVWSDGTIMYRDDHHLTATMSLHLTGALGDQLAKLLRQGPRSQPL